ncbi:MAG: hypothetical protein V2A55_00725 [Candidatus Jorgensenbacteria bacterium]
MSTEPLKNYIRSIDALRAGKNQDAEKLLADSLGIPELTPYMKSTLKTLVNADNPHEAVLTIILSNMEERNGK